MATSTGSTILTYYSIDKNVCGGGGGGGEGGGGEAGMLGGEAFPLSPLNVATKTFIDIKRDHY